MGISATRATFSALCVCIALALGGCSSMSKYECVAADWRTIGYEDGVAGHSGDRIAQHRKACAKHGVAPDLSVYQAGREEGLREYCQPSNGFRVGSQGGSYTGMCPADLDPGFASAYESGRQLYMLRAQVANTASRIEARRHELERVEKDIAAQSALIVSSESTGEERAQALLDTKQLAERAGRLKEEILQLEKDKARYERDLEEYRAGLIFSS